MRITVKLFAFFRTGRFVEEGRDYPEHTTVREIVRGLAIAEKEVGVTMRNSRHCELDSSLEDGDILAIFPVIGGG